jgi:transposase
MQISTIGIDLAKNVFQVHGVDGAGNPVLKKQLRRGQMLEFFGKLPLCLIGLNACATSHHWARELRKLGHDVRLMPPSYVKAYVKRGKNDAADAEAICEAVTRPSMRFVPIKRAEQQGALMLHRTRDLLIRQRTQLINAMRAHLAELGLVAQKGREGMQQLMRMWRTPTMRRCLAMLALPVGRSSHNCKRFRCRSWESRSASIKPIAPIRRANASMRHQASA